ncbi:glycosyltransferase family 2 protein [Candidatus Bathyarchaeota archaeon]|nr:MAG: glycosyltransferase family 2 protein [Candidatus Bathyarchaeota archaeon]
MKSRSQKYSKIAYLTFCIPFMLAYVSWMYFPVFAQWFTDNVFNYETLPPQYASWLWYSTVHFFYTWYTFLAIGVAGIWAIAATLAKRKQKEHRKQHYPMVSFVVPAYNEEKNVSRCIKSIFRCADKYDGLCEIIIIDDGSRDFTYEIAWATLELERRINPKVRGKVVRHSTNLGKIEAVKTGVNRALGSVIAVVDADSKWMPDTLLRLVDYMLLNGKKAVTGYVHPSDGNAELNPYVVLQQLEYSQGLGISRCAQALGNNVLVVSGAIGLYDAEVLREILNEKGIRSVTEDLEITLEMHKRDAGVGYVNVASSLTIAPLSFDVLWSQRLRWFIGWLHNTLNIHKDLLLKRSWLTFLLWYCYIFEYFGAFIDLTALCVFPFIFWFAPDRIFFILYLLVFVPYGFLIGVVNQSIALKYAYNKHNYRSLLFYTPFYPILRFINILARLTSSVKYFFGDHGNWNSKLKSQS